MRQAAGFGATLALSHWALRRRLPWRQVMGVGVAFVGVVLSSTPHLRFSGAVSTRSTAAALLDGALVALALVVQEDLFAHGRHGRSAIGTLLARRALVSAPGESAPA